MSKDRDIGNAKELIDELESLHGSLEKAVGNSDESRGDEALALSGIPILLDIIKSPEEKKPEKESGGNPISNIYRRILKPEQPEKPSQMDLSLIPTIYPEQSDEENMLNSMIDGLVVKYLPVLEAELRARLRERFSAPTEIH
ncbi:MAG: hypothetical protein KUG72_12055 [Pseudomonadales bacterium]|nr:hypothetical protein [Pseudomonadales bacterium]